ncbi:MAG: hypothetical protein RQ729_09055 [Wenzhouxiangellaceae bacterium]|nr:hypothetical protein [Wenzhouxiangellaceae bacterium]
MKYRLGALYRRSANSPLRRLYFSWLKHIRGVFHKRQSVQFVSINGKRYKRLELGDSFEAVQLEQALEALADRTLFPPLIHRNENQLLFGFIDGRPLDPQRADDLESMLRFFTTLYRSDASMQDPQRALGRLINDLAFLFDTGLIDVDLQQALAERAHAVCPNALVAGLDYIDPVAKNFVVTGEGVCAIDVESLHDAVPLGTGIAKAGLHWLDRDQQQLWLTRLDPQGTAGLRDQFAFVELVFRTGWTKRKLLQGKHHRIRIELLRELLD